MDLRLALVLLFTVSMALARNHARFSDLRGDEGVMDIDEVFCIITKEYGCNMRAVCG